MVGASDVVPHRLRGILPHEDGARVTDFPNMIERRIDMKLQMFGCEAVCQGDGIVQVRHYDDGAVAGERFFSDIAARQQGQLPGDFLRYRLAVRFEVVTRMADARESCSAWERRSAAV